MTADAIVRPPAWFEIERARASHINAVIRAQDAAAAVGYAEQRLEAARYEIKAATSALIFAKEQEAAVLPFVTSTYQELQRLTEADE